MKLLRVTNNGTRGALAATSAIRAIWLSVLTIAAVSAQAVIFTVNVSGPVDEISGPSPNRLTGLNIGDSLNFTFKYPSDLSLTASTPGWELYAAPDGTAISTLQVGPIDREFTHLDLNLYHGIQNTFNHRPQVVDMAWLFAFNDESPIDSISAMLFFPEGSLTGDPVLPSLTPLITFLTYTDYGATENDYAKAHAQVVQLSPVPEASTFGIMGALGLACLATVRRVRTQKRDRVAAAMAA